MVAFKMFIDKWFAWMETEKKNKKYSFSACKINWGFDYFRMKNGKKNPRLISYFKSCEGSGQSPVENMILFQKDLINPKEHIAFIRKTYNLDENDNPKS